MALVGAGCGGDDKGDPIPAEQRAEILNRLDETERRLDDGSVGACQDVLDDTEPEVDNVVATLPDSVDADHRRRLEDGLARLWELVSSECEQLEGQETDTETTPEPAPPPPEETETQTVPTTPEPEPDQGDGEGDGGGGEGDGGEGDTPGGGGGGGGGGGDGALPDVPGSGGGGAVPGEG